MPKAKGAKPIRALGLERLRSAVPKLRPFAVTQRAPYTASIDNTDTAPSWWPGSLPEWWVYHWLKYVRKLEEGRDFEYLIGVGGPRRTLFGIEVDFLIRKPEALMAWRVQGYYWHFVASEDAVRKDEEEKARLEDEGYLVIDFIDSDLTDPEARNSILSRAYDDAAQYYSERAHARP